MIKDGSHTLQRKASTMKKTLYTLLLTSAMALIVGMSTAQAMDDEKKIGKKEEVKKFDILQKDDHYHHVV